MKPAMIAQSLLLALVALAAVSTASSAPLFRAPAIPIAYQLTILGVAAASTMGALVSRRLPLVAASYAFLAVAAALSLGSGMTLTGLLAALLFLGSLDAGLASLDRQRPGHAPPTHVLRSIAIVATAASIVYVAPKLAAPWLPLWAAKSLEIESAFAPLILFGVLAIILVSVAVSRTGRNEQEREAA